MQGVIPSQESLSEAQGSASILAWLPVAGDVPLLHLPQTVTAMTMAMKAMSMLVFPIPYSKTLTSATARACC